jgi:hypothetical protein
VSDKKVHYGPGGLNPQGTLCSPYFSHLEMTKVRADVTCEKCKLTRIWKERDE